ncbi:MAG: sulfatase-like hydrolase/transferase [Lentisphaeria bacterium]|nr:sulfatase-like hydrolase/transferase [Lentisphaeria bacterium]
MAALEARGELDNTYVVFSSDHGEMAGDHGMYTKSVPYEAAIHVPLIVAGPGLPEGKVSDALVELMDVNPTLIELAGLPAQEGVEARSLVPVLQGHASTHRDSIVTTLRSFECIRTERYKYVNNYGDIRELYDLEEDPSELHNLCGERPEIAHELGMQLAQRLATPNDVH